MTRKIPTLTLAVLVAVSLAGCGRNMGDLHQYVQKVEARPAPPLKPIPQLEPYKTYTYNDATLRSPFEPPVAAHTSSGIRPDTHRNKEYLEQFPLDSLTMVGTIEMGGVRYALIKDNQGLVHRVRSGNYMGQNDGRIVAIGVGGLKLQEIVPNGLGGYVKRETKVSLAH